MHSQVYVLRNVTIQNLCQQYAVAADWMPDGIAHFVCHANMYQHNTLQEIAAMLERNARSLSCEEIVERVKTFCNHVQQESHSGLGYQKCHRTTVRTWKSNASKGYKTSLQNGSARDGVSAIPCTHSGEGAQPWQTSLSVPASF